MDQAADTVTLLAETSKALELAQAALKYYATGPDGATAEQTLAAILFATPGYQRAARVGAEPMAPPLLGEAPRSGHWPAVRRTHMEEHPECAVCGTKEMCVPHHMKPFHIWPGLELEPTNLITLCPPHHLLVGHLMNWRAYNPDVHSDAGRWARAIAGRPLATKG